MSTNLNLNRLNVDASGRASFSGLSSGIDIQGAVDSLIEAKRIPVDRIERRISENDRKIAALEDLSELTSNLNQAVDLLRGSVSFDGSSDIFESKDAFLTSSRTDSETPSSALEILGVTASSRAQASAHQIEVLQIAAAHKIASDSFEGSITDPMGVSGEFEINGAAIALDGSETIYQLRDLLNAANDGIEATGVTASVISISGDEQILVLTSDETGTDASISITDNIGTPLEDIGLLENTGPLGPFPGGGAISIKNELQAAKNSQISVDGLDQVSGVDVIERQSNIIDDVLQGITLSVFKSEPGTIINLNVEQNLNKVKSSLVNMVDAYNELRFFINTQSQAEFEDQNGDLISGSLSGTRVLSEVRARLADGVSNVVQGAESTFSGLAEIGIDIQSLADVGDPLQVNTLGIDETRLDEALLGQTDAVRELFSFDFSSSSGDFLMVDFSNETEVSENGYALNIAYSGGEIVSANINGLPSGADDGSVSIHGNRLEVETGGAKGLKILYVGNEATTNVQIDISIGLGSQLFDLTDEFLSDDSGIISSEIEFLKEQNQSASTRVDILDERLERERERLLERFVAMETAISRMNSLLDSLRQQIDSSFGNS